MLKHKIQRRTNNPFETLHCFHCFSDGEELMRCASCKTALYCSKRCQVDHWPVHAMECHSLGIEAAKYETPKPTEPPVTPKRAKVDRTPKMRKVVSAVSMVDVPSPSSLASDGPLPPSVMFVSGVAKKSTSGKKLISNRTSRAFRMERREREEYKANAQTQRNARSSLEARNMIGGRNSSDRHNPISLSDVERLSDLKPFNPRVEALVSESNVASSTDMQSHSPARGSAKEFRVPVVHHYVHQQYLMQRQQSLSDAVRQVK